MQPRPLHSPVRRRPLVVAVCLAVGLAACGSSDSTGTDSGPIDSSAPATSAATIAPTPETTELPPTTAAPVEPTGVPEGETAARRLYDAWVAGDRATAATIAEPAAVEAIFQATPGPYELYRGCDSGEFDTGGCLFRDRSTNNTIQIDLEKRDTGWIVSGAFFSTG